VKPDENTKLEVDGTGDPGLDRILGGGIPTRSTIVIAGEPGSGKTVLTLQTLFHAARRGKKCLYFTTVSEPSIKVMRHMQLFDFFDVDLLDERVIFVDLGEIIHEGIERTLAEIEARVEEHDPAFVAIDSFRAVSDLLRHDQDLRRFIYDVAVRTAGWGATTFLVGEYARNEYSSFAEFAIADGILHLGSERQGLTSVREIEILKLRGTGYSSGQHFFDITKAGISIYPRVSAPLDVQSQPSTASSERVRTGVEGLDDLLAGGLPRSSSTIVQGGTGTGKTLLSLQFLLEGAARGEKGIIFTLEETPDQLRSIARGLGWDLGALEEQDRLVIRYASPVELSTDRFLHEARLLVRELGAQRAVFDSLTTMALGVPSERRYKEMIYAITKHMRAAEVSLLLTAEIGQLLGSAQLIGHGVSFIADNLIQMRYVEIDGRLERAISVIKARGIQHDSELRSLTIGSGGLQVVKGRFKDMRGVLTGLPTHDERAPR
jgi:circadian clock protein KaiC